MKLSDMTDAEKQILGTLVRVMVGADRQFSDDEAERLQGAAAELGEDEFWDVVGEAGSHGLSEDQVRSEAQAVDRKEAQETIYGVLFGIAAAESIVVQEANLLDWVADVWGLEPGAAPAS